MSEVKDGSFFGFEVLEIPLWSSPQHKTMLMCMVLADTWFHLEVRALCCPGNRVQVPDCAVAAGCYCQGISFAVILMIADS